ncbi:uncharacterized protein EI90DRAFT_2956318, partial [Cantharellus anzutake]|uniref:uncharacterized protein n=1 Tax=Cantharellus anzutake TaxID=1750568 RepID=UPI001902DA0C
MPQGPSTSVSQHSEGTEIETDFDVTTPINHRVYENAHHTPNPNADDQPSSFLHSQCPLCFGGSYTKGEDVQAIICCDVNFQLKRIKDKDRRQSRGKDPAFMSPRTVFLSEDFVQFWKEHVETIRPTKKSSRKRRNREGEEVDIEHAPAGADDRREFGLPVPNSTYDACSESFIAADGERIKASTDYFVDTGVMAILC